ncbi:MAG: hypothetical protein CMM47_10630 [Rhodospirillaceae bacterium]|nr:hypothetical protein [Rhodospirillaceae bacterium]
MVQTEREKQGPSAKVQKSPELQQLRRRWVFFISILIILVIGLPAVMLTCLARSPGMFELRMVEQDLDTLACPSKDEVFSDCYSSIIATVTDDHRPPRGFLKACCSFLGERRFAAEIWANLAGSATILPNTGTTALGIVKTDGAAQVNIAISVSRTSERVLPWADQFLGQGKSAYILAQLDGFALHMWPRLLHYWPKDEAVADTVLTIPEGRPTVTIDAISEGIRRFRISIKTDIARTVLFPELVDLNTNVSEVGSSLGSATLPGPVEIASRLQTLGKSSGHQFVDTALLTKAAMTIQGFDGMSVSRLSRVSNGVDKFKSAGARCISLYRDLRVVLSKLDAALATYITIAKTGLLSRHAGKRDHGCMDTGSVLATELDRAWQRLRLDLPVLAGTVSIKEKRANLALDPHSIISQLQTIASAAKSGARHADLAGSFDSRVEVRVGHRGAIHTRDRKQILRLLHRQWTHIGCWTYDNNTLSLLAEAQFPYLNNLTFHRDPRGLVKMIAVTGVTFSQLERIQKINRGAKCQAFLNAMRVANYRDWLFDGSTNTRTPVDHAQRLLDIGPQKRFLMPFR